MRKLVWTTVKLLVAMGFCVGMLALAWPVLFSTDNSFDPNAPIGFVSPQDLKPGQRGFGLTTFQGDQPEKFEVEFAGIAPHPLSQREKVILVRMGKPLENSEVLAGMSGSPVYFQHQGKWKLAGALAFSYGSLSSDRALGGVTPIRAMLNQQTTLGLVTVPKSASKPKLSLEDLSKPVCLGQYQSLNIYMLRPKLQVITKTAESITNPGPAKIRAPKPGEAVIVYLTDGDVKMGITGTITYVAGNRFWAFGHPFLQAGEVALPAFRAVIATSFRSPVMGFKIVSRDEECIGFISYDNVFGVKGRIQELPENALLPVGLDLAINQDGKNQKAHFQFRIMKHRFYAPKLLVDGLTTLIEPLWITDKAITAVSTVTIELRDKTFVISDAPSTVKTARVLDYLMSGDWDLKIQKIRININVEAGRNIFRLDSYRVVDRNGKKATEIRPGDKIKLVLGLKNPNSTQRFVIALAIKIPTNLNPQSKGDNIDLYIESGNNFIERNPRKILNHSPDNPEELIQTMIQNERNPRKIYIQLVFSNNGTSTPLTAALPSMPENRWQRAEKLDFLRPVPPLPRRVVMMELKLPLQGYVADINQAMSLKLMPRIKKEAGKKSKTRSWPWPFPF